MARATKEDWSVGEVVVVPHAWRGDGLWRDIQSEAQVRIGAALREMYAESLRQPLSPGLTRLVYEIELRPEAPSQHG